MNASLPSISTDLTLGMYYSTRSYDPQVRIVSYTMNITPGHAPYQIQPAMDILDKVALKIITECNVPVKVIHKRIQYTGLGQIEFKMSVLKMDEDGQRIYNTAMQTCGFVKIQ